MMSLIITVHVIACVLLIIVILIQAGRGGGLVDSFSGVESMFGTKTNALLSRITTIFAAVFFATCIGLALFSARQSRSLLENKAAVSQKIPPVATAPKEGPKDSEGAAAAAVEIPPAAEDTQEKAAD
ncbi:MAG: preprotein translocase subunit SecG [Candidatus Omnitrophica bacterium]|nr:preprotein translocase subunit SecG [Candidatus Omnitrophota bacterium]